MLQKEKLSFSAFSVDILVSAPNSADERSSLPEDDSMTAAIQPPKNVVKVTGFANATDFNEELLRMRVTNKKFRGGPVLSIQLIQPEGRKPHVLVTFENETGLTFIL